MKLNIQIEPAADKDLDDLFEYIAAQNLETAFRFLDAASAAFERLAEMPGIGSLRDYENPRLSGVRMWPIPKFRTYLLFYRATEEDLVVIRVLHGARDIKALFEHDEDA